MTTTPATAAQLAPLLSDMPAYRIEAFRDAVAARMRDGKAAGVEQKTTLALLVREQQALVQALDDPAFSQTFASLYTADFAKQEPNATYAPNMALVGTETNGILQNRIHDAHGFLLLLANPHFLADAELKSQEPAPAPQPYALPAVKQEEMIRRLVQSNDPEGAEPRIHVAAAALGHQLVHQALANVYRPEVGGLRPVLEAALAKAWPESTPEQRTQLATNWLKARYDAAQATADNLKQDAPLYREAMRRADLARHETPHPIVALPTVGMGIVGAAALAPAAAEPTNMRAVESQKTRDERAADIAYTINHAISCLTTDVFVAPSISAAFSGSTSKLGWKHYIHEAGHYFQGEVAGDFLAVPLTVGVQRLFPNFMEGMSKFLEPIAAPFFRGGAKHAAEHWGKKHGLAADNQEVVDRAERIYNHEIKHLPQAAMWNVFSFPIGVVVQYMLPEHDHDHGHAHEKNIWKIVGLKAIGALISNGMLLGGRALAPDIAEKFDKLDSKFVIKPTTKAVGKLFGVNDQDIERMEKREESLEAAPKPKWAGRVAEQAQPANAAQAGAAIG